MDVIGNAVWGARMGVAVAALYWEAARHTWRKQLAAVDAPVRVIVVHT